MIANATLENQFLILRDSIETAIEYCRKSFERMKPSPKGNRYELLEKANVHLKRISQTLLENKDFLNDELDCFMEVEHYILYILINNCKNPSFDHIDCAVYLLKLFKKLINSKFEYLLTSGNSKEYECNLKEFPKKLYEFRMYFNENIFIKDHQFDEDIELLNLKLRSE